MGLLPPGFLFPVKEQVASLVEGVDKPLFSWYNTRISRHGGIGRRAGFRFQCLYDVEVQVLLPTFHLEQVERVWLKPALVFFEYLPN